MTPEETNLFTTIFSNLDKNFNEKFDKHAEEVRETSKKTAVLAASVENLEHSLLGNGQPGRIQLIESKHQALCETYEKKHDTLSKIVSGHARYIYIAVGGVVVTSALISWIITLVAHSTQ